MEKLEENIKYQKVRAPKCLECEGCARHDPKRGLIVVKKEHFVLTVTRCPGFDCAAWLAARTDHEGDFSVAEVNNILRSLGLFDD